MEVRGWREAGDEIEATTAGGLVRFRKSDILRIEGTPTTGALPVTQPPVAGGVANPRSGASSVRYVPSGDTNTATVT